MRGPEGELPPHPSVPSPPRARGRERARVGSWGPPLVGSPAPMGVGAGRPRGSAPAPGTPLLGGPSAGKPRSRVGLGRRSRPPVDPSGHGANSAIGLRAVGPPFGRPSWPFGPPGRGRSALRASLVALRAAGEAVGRPPEVHFGPTSPRERTARPALMTSAGGPPEQLPSSMRDPIWYPIREPIRARIRYPIREPIREPIRYPIRVRVRVRDRDQGQHSGHRNPRSTAFSSAPAQPAPRVRAPSPPSKRQRAKVTTRRQARFRDAVPEAIQDPSPDPHPPQDPKPTPPPSPRIPPRSPPNQDPSPTPLGPALRGVPDAVSRTPWPASSQPPNGVGDPSAQGPRAPNP